jgi:hypothetical protein
MFKATGKTAIGRVIVSAVAELRKSEYGRTSNERADNRKRI